jgi:hypothetical protein
MRPIALAAVMTIALATGYSQSSPAKAPEPEVLGKVYLLNSATQSLSQLPEEHWKAIGKPGFVTATGFIQVEGEHSTFRIQQGEKPQFVFNGSNADVAKLFELAVKHKKREFAAAKVSNGFFSGKREYLDGLGLDVSKYGGSSFKLVPVAPLAKGEYAINIVGKIFTFGVD